MDAQLQARAQQVHLLLLDVDGVLTDGRLYYNNSGEEFKAFSTLDGHGIKLLQSAGVKVGIITGRQSQLVARRARELGVELLVQGREDKWQALEEILHTNPVALDNIAFMGDDWPDLTIMTRVGLALTVANAHPSVAERAHWQSTFKGGEGAVREACDMLLKAQGHFDHLLTSYLAD
ncbi:HAD family hydrolase [Marinimicrobium sp. ABcell2]|uniref:KdsC family phosphatase n=1 Tax=Marinimicrobium sp. ABcell2 TaxID=3069751 RepID=UPI0027B1D50C|nr:HAD-IIIA family hydrolase [Marinimicrobium sp. ABcell2]MDQ2078270.1 HAD-IIIA family hydrolase [Marinimicrobium sp. ABcell2]